MREVSLCVVCVCVSEGLKTDNEMETWWIRKVGYDSPMLAAKNIEILHRKSYM